MAHLGPMEMCAGYAPGSHLGLRVDLAGEDGAKAIRAKIGARRGMRHFAGALTLVLQCASTQDKNRIGGNQKKQAKKTNKHR